MATDPTSPFCETCQKGSTWRSAPSLRSNQGIGRTFYGHTQACPTCGSTIRTLWWIFLTLPLFPRGSYRVISFEEEAANHTSTTAFISRKVPLHWPQVLRTWAVGLAALLFLCWILINRAR